MLYTGYVKLVYSGGVVLGCAYWFWSTVVGV